MGDAKGIPLVHGRLGTSAEGHREYRHTALVAGTDLVSPERTEELARAQYRSLQRRVIADSWSAAGEQTALPILTPSDVGSTPVLDVRQASEFDAGRVRGARHVELSALPAKASERPAGQTVVVCGGSFEVSA